MEVEKSEFHDLNSIIQHRRSSTRGCLRRSNTVSLSFNIFPWLAAHIVVFCLPVVLTFLTCRFLDLDIVSVFTPGFLPYVLSLSGFGSLLLLDLLFPGFTRYHVLFEALQNSSRKPRAHWSFITPRRWRQYLPPERRWFTVFVRGILASSIALSVLGSTTIAEVQDRLLHHNNIAVRCSIARLLHHFETAGRFPRVLPLCETLCDAGVQPDSHLYVKFLLLGGADSGSASATDIIPPPAASTSRTSSRPRKQAAILTDPANGEPEFAALDTLVDRISALTRKLPSSVAIAARDGAITKALALSGQDGDAASTFNRRMDVLFGEELRDESGRLIHVARGKYGMAAVVAYLTEVPWSELQPIIVRPKLERLVRELDFLCSESASKRKSPDPSSDVEDDAEAKRRRTGDKNDADFNPGHNEELISVHDSSDGDSDTTPLKVRPKGKGKATSKKKKTASGRTAPAPDVTGDDGMLVDIEVQEIESDTVTEKQSPIADVLHFSGKAFARKSKQYRTCSICGSDLVADPSTHRRHYNANHKAAYHKWCKNTSFESKLSPDVQARKIMELKKQVLQQQQLDSHLREKPARPAKYTDELFLDAAIDWLIATDQPIDALTNPKFQELINIAARATEGVTFPNRAQTRAAIIKLFHNQMNKLKIRLHSDAVRGMIHITCDAWQASNTDGYYAVTGHWIEETAPGKWELKEALLGFTRMNEAHNGVRLGQALFKIVQRMGLALRVGYVTCDNASNNGTMLAEFARQMSRVAKIKWDPVERRINCLAHVINIATQKLISTYSKSEHYNPHDPHAHVPETCGTERDEIGLLRAIAVKERSSSQRKGLFRKIQLRSGDPDVAAEDKTVKQLILDMKVRWSSTYAMLDRGYELREAVDQFISEIALKELDREKSDKLDALKLTAEEWQRVDLFLNVLQCAQNAQHAFSSDLRSTLHLAIPALERLHAEWTAKASKSKYTPFHSAIEAALSKVGEYYQKTDNSNSYALAMVLDPRRKLGYFEKNWSKSLTTSTTNALEKIFKERYNQLKSEMTTPTVSAQVAPSQKSRRRASTPLDDDHTGSNHAAHIDPTRPWMDEFTCYLQARETVPEGMSSIEWWGQNHHRYPIWGSLARDYLAIMSSSVSSERAFSSAGITISKRRNRLKADIVEALQCLKCFILRNLLFRDPGVFKEGDEDVAEMADETPTDESRSWDLLVDDDPDNYEFGS